MRPESSFFLFPLSSISHFFFFSGDRSNGPRRRKIQSGALAAEEGNRHFCGERKSRKGERACTGFTIFFGKNVVFFFDLVFGIFLL